MLFNSLVFAIFLCVVLFLYFRLGLKGQNRLLIVASYVFYGSWDWRFLFLLAISTVVDFWVGTHLGQTESPRKRLRLLQLSLVVNLGILGFFKYFDFFITSTQRVLEQVGFHPDFFTLNVILPVGISFYTFQTIAYTYSVYKREIEPTRDFTSFAIYVAYFPQLVAGPIESAQHLLPQIRSARLVTRQKFQSGLRLMLQGYLKKVAIADAVAPLVEEAFSNPGNHSSLMLLIGVYLYTIQVYGDFSGYTDIARGASRLMGIELMVNFKQPYLAPTISMFWRRWHVSLSQWLRKHIYIPLGGNRHGTLNTYRNVMLTVLFGGLWHGADWTFVIWGALHGVYLIGHRVILSFTPRGRLFPENFLGTCLGIFCTFHLVVLTRIFFRSPDFGTAGAYLQGLAQGSLSLDKRWLIPCAFYLALIFVMDILSWTRDRETPVSEETPWGVRGLVYAAAVVLILYVGNPYVVPFIYFQF